MAFNDHKSTRTDVGFLDFWGGFMGLDRFQPLALVGVETGVEGIRANLDVQSLCGSEHPRASESQVYL